MNVSPSQQGLPPERQMKETLYTRHRNTVEPMTVKNCRKATLQALHTDDLGGGKPTVHTRCIAAHKSGLLLHPQRMQ